MDKGRLWTITTNGDLLRCEDRGTHEVIYDRIETNWRNSRLWLFAQLADVAEQLFATRRGISVGTYARSFETNEWRVEETQPGAYRGVHKPSGKLTTWHEYRPLFSHAQFTDTRLAALRDLATQVLHDFYTSPSAGSCQRAAITHTEGWLQFVVGEAGLFSWKSRWFSSNRRQPTILGIWQRKRGKTGPINVADGDKLEGEFDLSEAESVHFAATTGKRSREEDRGAFKITFSGGRKPLKLIAEGATAIAEWHSFLVAIMAQKTAR